MKPKIAVDITHHITDPSCPSDELIYTFASTALALRQQDTEVSICIVDIDEMSELNQTYRHKKGPTNVLSFPFEKPDDLELTLIGDIVICLPKVITEAQTQQKTLIAHFAHLTIHGCLHLLGYDHDNEKDAQIMEQLEIELLASLNFSNPYQEKQI